MKNGEFIGALKEQMRIRVLFSLKSAFLTLNYISPLIRKDDWYGCGISSSIKGAPLVV